MNFSKKIFLAVLGVSVLSGLATSLLLYNSFVSARRQEFAQHYLERLQLLGDSFKILEKASDSIAYDAAQVIDEKYRHDRRLPSNAELAALASELGISHVQIADRAGRFIRSTGNPATRNLFDYCPQYRDLFTGKTGFQHTPVIPDETGGVYKYALLPTYDLKNAIDVNIHFDFATKVIKASVDADPAMGRVELFSPTGGSLGMVAKPGFVNHPMPPQDVVQSDTILWQHDRLLLSHSVPADVTNCCECQIKRLVNAGGDFKYRLVAFISLTPLENSLAAFKWKIALVFLFVTALCFGLASWITRLLEARKTEAQAQIAAQVAHDIRSPLTSMSIALGQLQQSIRSEGRNPAIQDAASALKSGVERVTGILKKLSTTYGIKTAELKISDAASSASSSVAAVEAPRLTLIDKLLRDVAHEHQLKLSAGSTLELSGFAATPSVWAVVQPNEIQSAISNILNNAFEALDSRQGRVEFALALEGSQLRITLRDNGIGIPAENVGKIFEREFTSGKKGGNGLGLFQAKSAIEWSGGKISVHSSTAPPVRGTTFTITLPVEKQPSWIAARISLLPDQKIVFVDDDPSILDLWKSRTCGLPEETASFFTTLAELWSHGLANSILVIDQYLGPESSGTTGLKFLGDLKLKKMGYLCTSEFDEPAIQEKVRALGVRLIPKPCIAGIEIHLEIQGEPS